MYLRRKALAKYLRRIALAMYLRRKALAMYLRKLETRRIMTHMTIMKICQRKRCVSFDFHAGRILASI
jgi:hypothetical protein